MGIIIGTNVGLVVTAILVASKRSYEVYGLECNIKFEIRKQQIDNLQPYLFRTVSLLVSDAKADKCSTMEKAGSQISAVKRS